MSVHLYLIFIFSQFLAQRK